MPAIIYAVSLNAHCQETADMQTLAHLLDAGAPDKAAVVTPNGPSLTYRTVSETRSKSWPQPCLPPASPRVRPLQ